MSDSSTAAGGASAQRVSESSFIARVTAYVLAAVGVFTLRVDPDLWGHLRFGLDVLRHRELTERDPYSFTSDVAWINHEWLSETLTALAYTAWDVRGLLILKAAVVAIAYMVMAHRLRDIEPPARWWFLSVAIAATMTLVWSLRPQLWTVLFLTVLASTMHWPVRRQLLFWPVLFALWANLHGGWIVGLGVLFTWSAGTVLDRRDRSTILLLSAVCLLCLFSTLMTPYGIDLWLFMLRTVGFGRDIAEWRPVWEVHGLVMLLWSAVAATVVVTLRHTPWSWAAALPVILLGVSSFKVIRLIGLFGIVAILLLGVRWRRRTAPSFGAPLLACVWFVALVPAAFLVRSQVACLPVNDPDLVAAGALREASPGRLMVPFDWGQYAIWHFNERLRVSMDGRRETVYSQRMIDLQLGLDRGRLHIVPFILSERPEYIWLPQTSEPSLSNPLHVTGYRQDIETDRSSIWVRSDLPVLQRGHAMPGCFP